jgi:hypothetical protein
MAEDRVAESMRNKPLAAVGSAQRARIGSMTARELAAYHEAGHALVGYLKGARLLSVQVEGAAGRTHFVERTLTGERLIRIAMAGPAAEYMYAHPYAGGFTLADCNASKDDLQEVDNYCADLPPQGRQRVREQVWAETCDVLVLRWPDVQALAGTIIEHGCLHGRAVTALLNRNTT